LLLVDGWEDVCAAAEPVDAGRCADQLLELMRCATSVGVTVVLAGDRASLAGRVTGAATRRFVLPLADRADYAAAGVSVGALPADPPPGRAVRVPDGAAVQFGFAGPAADRWVEAVDRLAADPHLARPPDPGLLRIRELPQTVLLAEIDAARRAPRAADRLPFVVGVGGATAAALVADLARGARALLVAGPARSGRSTVLSSALLQLATASGTRAVVLAPPRSPLRLVAERHRVPVAGTAGLPTGPDPELILVDDCDHVAGAAVEAELLDRLADPTRPVTVMASLRSEQLALAFRGLPAELRAYGCALLLAPTAADADLFGVAAPRTRRAPVPGRGILIADPAWGLSEPAPRVQVALP
jgi:S-DNA-T family DNA segregation ATPase FtsK/SpoIIIE